MTTETPATPDDDLLAAEYVLGVLPHAERLALARRIETDAALARRVRDWDEKLSPLADVVEPVAPPASLLGAVERRLFAGAAAGPRLWESLMFWRGVSAVLAGALVAAALLLVTPRLAAPERDNSLVAELAGEGQTVRLAAFFDARSVTLRLNRIAGQPQKGRDFELWLIAGGQAPVSLGTLPQESMISLKVAPDIASKLASGAVLAVSDEPLGGSPTGQPTGAVLATGALSAI